MGLPIKEPESAGAGRVGRGAEREAGQAAQEGPPPEQSILGMRAGSSHESYNLR